MRFRTVPGIWLLVWLCCSPLPLAAQCAGDCNGDGRITVDEIIAAVTAALTGGLSCQGVDRDNSGAITVDELLSTVSLALNGCLAEITAAPALTSSFPASSATGVSPFEWLRLEFASDIDPRATGGFRLTCDGTYRPAGVYLDGSRSIIVNPDRELPSASDCVLQWTGPDGEASIPFATLTAGEPGEVFYDRTDHRRTSPFPDDFWLAPDPAKPNGVRFAFPVPEGPGDLRGIFRALLNDTRDLDGFSPIGHLVVELSEAPLASSLPRTSAESLDPRASVGLFDVTDGSPTYGHRIPFRIDVRDDRNVAGIRSHTLLIFPSIPLEPGGQYGLVVTRRVRIDERRSFGPSDFLRRVLSPPEDDEDPAILRARELAEPVITAVRAGGLPLQADDVALVVRLTVRTTDDIPRDLLEIRRQVQAAPPPAFTITSVQPSEHPQVAAIVSGEWQAPDWRDGLFFRRDQNGLPVQTKTNTVPFILALPRAALDHPVPITMYQHGNPGSAEREVPGEVRDYLGEAGFAVIGFTDNLNREVSAGSGGSVEAITRQITTIFFSLVQSRKLPDFWVQLNGEQLAFLRMIESLGSLDVLPVGAPDGVPELDPTLPLTYVGISQGANYAPGFLPYAPEIRSAAVVVGGARLAEVLIHQAPDAFLNQLGALYVSMTAADIWTAMSLFQAIYDKQDQHNHGRFLYRAPLEIDGTTRKASILMLEGLDDTLVPNHATNSLAWAVGPIPHLEPVQRPVPFLERVEGPVVANIDAETTAAFFQYVPVGIDGIDPTPGCAALNQREGHYCAQSAAESERQRTVFFQTTLSDPAPTIIDPTESITQPVLSPISNL